MRIMRRGVATLTCVLAATVLSASGSEAQQQDPYHGTLYFGTGLVTIPVAWVSPHPYDAWVTASGKDLPSFPDPSKQQFASLWNTNISLDVHLFGRASVGVSAYDQNPDYGFFGQVLLLPERADNPLPALAVGFRNLGSAKHEDRFFIAHDVSFNGNTYDKAVAGQFLKFKTAPSFYGVATKSFGLGVMSSRLPGATASFSIGYGNGVFSDDGGLGDSYNRRGTIAKGLFLGGRVATHPSLNSSLDLVLDNDGFDYNAGLVYDWRGLSVGVYGTELEEGGRNNTGFYVYNYTKFNVALGYSGNIIDISKGVLLRTRITDLTREQQRLNAEIAVRGRRIAGLEVALRKAQAGELAGLANKRAELEKSVQEERDAIRRAEERLRSIQQNQTPSPAPTPTPPPSSGGTPPLN
jgi:uncharacterized coiled-coil protein SlyX